MAGKHGLSTSVAVMAAALTISVIFVTPVLGYRICNFKGTVVDHGWRSMTVKTRGECATVNVGWRTKYIPNRRPCLGERVSVDFLLEDGYMKATKVVSLTSPAAPVECYPPPPPGSTRCRSVPDTSEEVCVPPRQICSRTPPPHVTGERLRPKPRPARVRKPRARAPEKERVVRPTKEEEKEKKPEVVQPPKPKTLTGEVVASSPQSLSIRVMDEQDTAEVMNVRVGLRTRFIPFRRPAVGERVEVEFKEENGSKFGEVVKVIE